MGRRSEQTFSRSLTNGQQTHEKMLNITNYQRNANKVQVSTKVCKLGMQIRYELTRVRMSIIKKSTNSKCWRECGETGTLLHCWWECKLVQPLWRTVWRCLKKLKTELPYDPAIPFLSVQLEKTIILKDTCTPMFVAALFTISKTWKQPKCPSTDERIKKKWSMYTMNTSHRKQ